LALANKIKEKKES